MSSLRARRAPHTGNGGFWERPIGEDERKRKRDKRSREEARRKKRSLCQQGGGEAWGQEVAASIVTAEGATNRPREGKESDGVSLCLAFVENASKRFRPASRLLLSRKDAVAWQHGRSGEIRAHFACPHVHIRGLKPSTPARGKDVPRGKPRSHKCLHFSTALPSGRSGKQ